MNKQYIDKLIKLTEELIELNKPTTTIVESAQRDMQMTKLNFVSKLNYLLGYIMSLKEFDKNYEKTNVSKTNQNR